MLIRIAGDDLSLCSKLRVGELAVFALTSGALRRPFYDFLGMRLLQYGLLLIVCCWTARSPW